jgi:hypothetical protein
MGKGNKSGMRRGFGADEDGNLLLPAKVGNVKISRIEQRIAGGSLLYVHCPTGL